MVTISDEAKKHLIEIMQEEGLDLENSYLRVAVKGGGCSGLSYVMDFDDTITENDELFDNKEIKVIVEKKHLLYLYGTELQFSDGLNGKGFHWVNPQATRTCGCGESFSI